MGNLKAAAVKAMITPSENWWNTYGTNSGRGFTGMYEDIYARILVLAGETQKFILIAAELGSFPGQKRLAAQIEAEFGVPEGAVWLTSNHNHQMFIALDEEDGLMKGFSDPAGEAYIKEVHEAVMDGLRQAMAQLKPARMGFGTGLSYINVNRDCPRPAGTILGSNPGGYSDKELAVLYVEDLKGNPIYVFANYAMHNLMLFGSTYAKKFDKAGGDISAAISRYVEEWIPGCVAGWGIAAAGDQNPIYTSNLFNHKKTENDTWEEYATFLEVDTCFTLMDHMARIQAQDILQIKQGITEYTEDFSLAFAITSQEVRGRKSYCEMGIFTLLPGQVFEKIESDPVKFSCRLAVLGDIAFVGINCELYSRLGSMIKAMLPYKKVIFLEMIFGLAGYIPDAESEKLNGHGTWSSRAYSGAETEIGLKNAYQRLIEEIKNK